MLFVMFVSNEPMTVFAEFLKLKQAMKKAGTAIAD
jgi:hypothetical protein